MVSPAPVDAVDAPAPPVPAADPGNPGDPAVRSNARGPASPATRTTPYLELDLEIALERFRSLQTGFGPTAVHYAVKANPDPELVAALHRAGSRFDVASPAELDLCLAVGADPRHLVYSNPVKRRADIAEAYARGVEVFVADSADEIAKLADVAPGSRLLVRLGTSGLGSDWPLSGKFGCTEDDLVPLLLLGAELGLDPTGVAFHVGSQQRDPGRWERPIAVAAGAFTALAARGRPLRTLDLGGGFPAEHEGGHPPLARYVEAIGDALDRHFPAGRPELVVEPGRGIAGDAGVLVSQVIGVVWRGGRRWVHLDVGVYTGLVETLGEAIRYRLRTARDDGETGLAVLAGPTCDSVDVLYEQSQIILPLALREGDEVAFLSAGAYTATYSTVGFNGFAPLPTHRR